MSWSVVLEDEFHEEISNISDELFINETSLYQSNFILLKYLHPYGNTVFNSYQIEDLILDLRNVKFKDNKLIKEIISLALKCKEEGNLYLIFYGD